MKHASQAGRILKIGISLGYYLGMCASRLAARLLGMTPKPTCVVLYYHAVTLEHREAFARQMDALVKLTTPIHLGRVPKLAAGTRYSAVTFDDFFENVLDNALPEMKKKNIPAALFVTTDVLGKHAGWWPEAAPERQQRIGSVQQLRELPAESILIGSHTLTHPKLPELNERDAVWEIRESRRVLETLLDRKVGTFSFPYGAFNSHLVECCRGAGYERIFTTLPTMAFANPAEFVTGRVNAEPTDWPLEFRLKLVGAYQWLPYAFVMKRHLLSSSIMNSIRNVGAAAKSEA